MADALARHTAWLSGSTTACFHVNEAVAAAGAALPVFWGPGVWIFITMPAVHPCSSCSAGLAWSVAARPPLCACCCSGCRMRPGCHTGTANLAQIAVWLFILAAVQQAIVAHPYVQPQAQRDHVPAWEVRWRPAAACRNFWPSSPC